MNKKTMIAITGPTMSGKTTLTSFLNSKYDIPSVVHTTTREKRIDDLNGFYRYINISDFNELQKNNSFLIASGCGDIKYGILREDIENITQKNGVFVANISYKDIHDYLNIKFNKYLIGLTFNDINNSIINRNNASERKLLLEKLKKRILAAKSDEFKYFSEVKKQANKIIYVDNITKSEMLNIAEEGLILANILDRK